LLTPGETIYLMGDAPATVPELLYADPLPCLQMVWPPSAAIPAPVPERPGHDPTVVPLTIEDAPAMVSLTDLAFPGFFRARTCEMGSYFGVRADGQLVAMGGERLAVPGWREISGICTRPGYTGKGLAALLIAHLLREHERSGLNSFLHVGCANARAIDLYYRLGFSLRKQVLLYPLSRRLA
jgi:ribosomal protein S18 acetylase RimI-like enzyme